MDGALDRQWLMADQDQRITQAIDRDRPRLRNFIRRQVADQADAEEILQDVFYELVEAYRLMKPVKEVTAWLFRVAHNRIIDLFRKRGREAARFATAPTSSEAESASLSWEDLLPSLEAGPETEFARTLLIEELEDALEELPAEQRVVFVAHEIDGESFAEIAKRTGVSVNTLLSRKHYAVMYLRKRLQSVYEDFRRR